LKQEALGRSVWRARSGGSCGPVVKTEAMVLLLRQTLWSCC